MWIILAIISFAAGQAYLLYCLGKFDHFTEQQTQKPHKKETLTIAFADPTTANHMADLLARFSSDNPDIEIMLFTSQDVLEAVYAGKAAIGFLQAGQHEYPGLNAMPLTMNTAPLRCGGTQIIPMEDTLEQEMICKRSGFSSPADTFVRYLRDRGMFGSRKAV